MLVSDIPLLRTGLKHPVAFRLESDTGAKADGLPLPGCCFWPVGNCPAPLGPTKAEAGFVELPDRKTIATQPLPDGISFHWNRGVCS